MTIKQQQRFRRWLAVALAANWTLTMFTGAPAADAAAGNGLDVVGQLAIPWLDADEDRAGTQPRVAAIDAENDRLYLFIQRFRPGQQIHLAEYDTSTEMPTPLRLSETGVTDAVVRSPYTAVIDSRRNRMLVTSVTHEEGRGRVEVIDLKTLSRTATWELATSVPGFLAMGLTYDRGADRLYFAGEFSAAFAVDALSRAPGRPYAPGPAVVSLDPEDGTLLWARPLPGCRSMLRSTQGSFVGRSKLRPVLYAFCDGGSAAASQVITGQNALARIHIDDDADVAQGLDFPVELFPVSGKYVGDNSTLAGIVGFDAASERVFAQSLSRRTAGGWVFDGQRSAWVGFVGAPEANDFFLGVNPANGRYYLAGYNPGGGTGYINVTDGRATPIAQGTTFPGRPMSSIVPDPDSNRLVTTFDKVITPGTDTTPQISIEVPIVLRDTTPSITPLAPADYDSLTSDIPDAEASLQFSAGASGFGARYELVGGVEGAHGRAVSGETVNPAGLAVGDRGTMLAVIPRVDIRQAGASATAAPATVDEGTDSDRSDAVGQAGVPGPAAEALAFPYGVSTCLDGNGERIETNDGIEGDPGRAAVVCDLAKLEAKGSAAFADKVGAGGISVAAASFDTRTFRDAKRGVVTESTAVAEGIALRSPQGQRVAIDRVVTTATTAANGRPDAATAVWERIIEGATLVDADGKASPAQSCTSQATRGAKVKTSGNCDELARRINEAMATEMRVRFPMPRMTATPRGAFAAVEKSENDFLDGLTTNNDELGGAPGMEAVVFNDGAEKSRLLVQLASIRADAIFTRSPIPTFTDPPAGDAGTATSGIGGGAGGQGATTGSSGAAAGLTGGDDLAGSDVGAPVAVGPPVVGVAAAPQGGIFGWLIGARTPRDAAMAAGVWLLFGSALAAAWRRRRLIETLGG